MVPDVKSRYHDECIAGRKTSIQVRSGIKQPCCVRAVASTKVSAARKNILSQSGAISGLSSMVSPGMCSIQSQWCGRREQDRRTQA
jgi:hypothetical protein